MRRFLLPAVVLAVVIAAATMANRANDAADPTDNTVVTGEATVGTPLLSARRAPEWLRQPASDEALRSAVLGAVDLLHDDDAHCVAVRRDGEAIADVNADTALIPGATQRLATLAAFSERSELGFTTEVVKSSAAVVTDGVFEGDLWIVGGGDPVLSTDAFITRFADERTSTSFEELAQETIAALQADGVVEISGAVIADHAKYGAARIDYLPGTYTPAELDSNTIGALSALIVDNGFDTFGETVDPAARDRAANPADHAAETMVERLEAAGIVVTGGATTGDQPASLDRIGVASVDSPPLADIARRAYLDATTAEMLFLEFGLRSGQPADQGIAGFLLPGALVESGALDAEGTFSIVVGDGSGLSLGNRARCDVLANILDAGPDALAVAALPDSAGTGLGDCTPIAFTDLAVVADARPELNAIAGRAVTPNGDVITFAMIVNWAADAETGSLAERTVCDDVVASLLQAIAQHPAGPELDQFSPLAPETVTADDADDADTSDS